MKDFSLLKRLNLIFLMSVTLFLVGCGDKVLVDNGIYGFTLNEAESEQMQGRLQNPPANKARIYVIIDYAHSSVYSSTSDLKQFKLAFGSNSIMLKTEAQVKSKAQATNYFGYIHSGIFSVDIVPNGEAIYLYKEQSATSLVFGNRSDGWETRIVPKVGQIHCLSLYQRPLENVWTLKMIVTRKENVSYPVIWAEKKDCMILVNRFYDDKVEFETENKDEKAKLKTKRIERDNKLLKEREHKTKKSEIKHHSGALTQ